MSRLDTVHRVARLREAGARARFAAASFAYADALSACTEREQRLAATRLVGGSAPQVQGQLDVAGRAGDAVGAARVRAAELQHDRDGALRGWTEATRDEHLLATACDRARLGIEAERERRDQRMVDDLTGRRPEGDRS